MNKKIVLVTGGYGMAGKALLRIVRVAGIRSDFVFIGREDGDLTDQGETDRLFERYNPTYVIHLAASIGGLYYNMVNNAKLLDLNCRINLNVTSACVRYGVKKAILVSSTCAFPAQSPRYPMTEDDHYSGEIHYSNEGYGEGKRMLDRLARLYNKDQNVTRFVTVFPCNLYGPEDDFSEEKSHVIGGLMRKCYLAKLNNGTVSVYGTGKALRQFLYVDDFARLLLMVLNEFNGERMIMSSTTEHSICDLIHMISTIAGLPYNRIVYDTNKSDGLIKKTTSNDLLRSTFPNFKFTMLEDGLKLTYSWFVNNYDISQRVENKN